jgi:putative SOS response-associated peptidase YedK
MIVTEASEFAGRVHDRMPVFLAGNSFETWLGGSAGVELLCSAVHSQNIIPYSQKNPNHRKTGRYPAAG